MACVCTLLAWFDPVLPSAHDDVVRVVLVDASSSTGRRTLDALDWDNWTRDLDPDDLCAVIAFGETARTVRPAQVVADGAGARWSEPLRVGRHASDLAAGLQAAAVVLRAHADRARQVRIVSDGLATSEHRALRRATTELARAGCSAVQVQWVEGVVQPASVTSVTGPGRVAMGAPFAIEVTGVLPGTASDSRTERSGATLELLRDGVPESVRTLAGSGPFRVRFDRVETLAGNVVFTARLDGAAFPDGPLAAAARVVVRRPRTPLFVGTRAAPWDGVPTIDTSVFDRSPQDWTAAYDVLLMDGPSDDTLSPSTLDHLRAFVAGGGGLIWLGGPTAFQEGRWTGRPIEDLVPLHGRPPDDRGLFLYVGLDASGSMARPWSGDDSTQSKDDVVRAAALGLLEASARDTSVALRRFNDGLLPAGTAIEVERLDEAGRASVAAAVRSGAEPSGSTSLLAPLREAHQFVTARPERRRCVLLLTDGRVADRTEELSEAVRALLATGAQLEIVVPGTDGAGDTLSAALRGTGVTPRVVARAENLSALFRDVEGSARTASVRLREQTVAWSSDAPSAFQELGALPRVPQLHPVFLAEGATQLAQTAEGRPFLAWQRRGVGVTAALATAPGRAAWWTAEGVVQSLVTATVGLVSGRAGDRGEVRLDRAADGRFVVATGERDAHGAADDATPVRVQWGPAPSQRTALHAVGPALFESGPAAAGAATPGLDVTHVTIESATGRVLGVFGIDRPVAAEYARPESVDLEELASTLRAPVGGPRRGWRAWWALVAVLALLAGALAATGWSPRARRRDQVPPAPAR